MTKLSFFVMFMLLLRVNNIGSQVGASIVYDPTNGAQIANVVTTLDKLKKAQEEWKSNTEFLNKIKTQGMEVKRLISLLESLVCATDEFDLYIGVVGNMTLCNRKLKIDITMGKLDGISGTLKTILSGAVVLSQFETIESLKSLNDQLEDGINGINELNTDLRMDVVSSLNALGSKSSGSNAVSWSSDAGI